MRPPRDGLSQKLLLCLHASGSQGLHGIRREGVLVDYYFVEFFFEKIGALLATMPIVDSKERTFRPRSCFVLRLRHVHNHRNPILVTATVDALVRICPEGTNKAA